MNKHACEERHSRLRRQSRHVISTVVHTTSGMHFRQRCHACNYSITPPLRSVFRLTRTSLRELTRALLAAERPAVDPARLRGRHDAVPAAHGNGVGVRQPICSHIRSPYQLRGARIEKSPNTACVVHVHLAMCSADMLSILNPQQRLT